MSLQWDLLYLRPIMCIKYTFIYSFPNEMTSESLEDYLDDIQTH